MFQNLIHFLISKDLSILMLPKELQEKTVSDLAVMAERSAFDALRGEVRGEKRGEFEKLLEVADQGKIEAFLKSHVPHYEEIVTTTTHDELARFTQALGRANVATNDLKP